MSLRSAARRVVESLHLGRPARLALRAGRRLARELRRFAAWVTAVGETARSAPGLLILRLAYRRLLTARIAFERLLGTPDDSQLAIVACLWDRPERIEDLLRIVDGQRTTRRLRLVLWNNRAAHTDLFRAAIAAYRPVGALASVELYNSASNVGGIGRFIAIRELRSNGYRGPFVMIDDDQDFGDSFVEDLETVTAPKAISGVWAWNNTDAYWHRTQVTATGAAARHVGTGGSICDSEIVSDPRFFTAIPTRFLFMEDIWMCHYARRNGWRLTMVESPFAFVLSERDQGHAIFDRKEHFFRWLQDPSHIPLVDAAIA